MTDIYLKTLLSAGHDVGLMLPHDAWLSDEIHRRNQSELLFALPTGWRGRLLLDPFFRRRVRRYLADADLVITHNVLLESALRSVTNCPIVAVNHLDKMGRMGRCDAVIALNSTTRDRLTGSGGGLEHHPERALLLPNGLEQMPEPVRQAGGGEVPCVGYLGALGERKGCIDLMEAAELSKIERLQLIFAGEGDLLPRLKQMAAKSRHQVEFTGHISDLPGFFTRCDLICLPSHWEICPLALIEAMAYRMPVIGAVNNATEDFIEEGVSGLLAPPQDPPALAKCLDRAFADTELRQTPGRRCPTPGRATLRPASVRRRTAKSRGTGRGTGPQTGGLRSIPGRSDLR